MKGAMIMASAIGGASSSNLSSLYNSANMISGLASGLDTEGMIESLVQSYSKKITGIQQQVTKTEWEQEAYRSIISKMASFSSKYASYSSSTNLLSSSFFNNAIKVAAKGTYASAVTASGKTTSDIQLNEVSQLATSARWSTNGVDGLLKQGGQIVGSSKLDLTGDVSMGSLSGSLVLTYGDQTISLLFDEATDANIKSTDDLVKTLRSKLSETTISVGGTAYKASDIITVDHTGGKISFTDTKNNKFYISSASGNLAQQLGLKSSMTEEDKVTSFTPTTTNFTTTRKTAEYISGSSMTISLNGSSKSITMPIVESTGENTFKLNGMDYDVSTQQGADAFHEAYAEALNYSVQKVFGSKMSVDLTDDGQLAFYGKSKDDEIIINCTPGKALGIGRTATSYLSTSKTLEELGIDLSNLTAARDKNGNLLTDEKGETKYALNINGVTVGNYSKNTDLATILSDINDSDAGVKVSYSKLSNNFVFTTKETGSEQQIEIRDGDLAARIFGSTADARGNLKADLANYTKGQDSEFTVTINGVQKTMTRSSNSVTLDGMTLNMKETFGANSRTSAVHTISQSDVAGLLRGSNLALSFVDAKGVTQPLNVDLSTSGATDAASLAAFLNDNETFAKYFQASESDGSLTLTAKDPAMGTELSMISSGTTQVTKRIASTFDYFVFKADDFQEGDTAKLSYVDGNGQTQTASITLRKNANGRLDTGDVTSQLATLGLDSYFTAVANESGNPYLKTTNAGASVSLSVQSSVDSTAKAEYKETDAVTFSTSTDADPIVDAIKTMVADYNIMIQEIKSAYSTMPVQKSNGDAYLPLTDEDMADMSESAIEKYEEKAKKGLLFGDNTLSSLYEKLRFIFSPGGEDGALLQKMGISTSYSTSDGALTVTVDETKLRSMLESDPEAVSDVFTRASTGNNGIMQKLKTQMDAYAATTGATKGILVRKAGTPLSSLSLLNNTLQTRIDNLNEDIEEWQDKLSNKVDYYTKQFTRLETLINEMNSQSSALAGLMGGY